MRPASDFSKYQCSDYLESDYSRTGFYSRGEEYWIVEPVANAEELTDSQGRPFLKVGGPGVDGIAFAYRQGERGLWAYYPIDGEYKKMANTIEDLIQGWTNGALSV